MILTESKVLFLRCWKMPLKKIGISFLLGNESDQFQSS